MRKTRLVLFVLSFFLVVSLSIDFHGPAYQKESASTKLSQLQSAVLSNKQPGHYYSTVEQAEIFIESMDTSFDTVADDMPYQFLGTEKRKKLIHSVGVIAPGRWTVYSNPYNYTGVFASGAENIFVRLSSAGAPLNTTGPSCLGPGISVKVLRDNFQSANLLALYALTGQEVFNFFKHDLTNHVPDLGTDAPSALWVLRSRFETASAWPPMLGLSDFAIADSKGNVQTNPRFPFRLILHPTTYWHNRYGDNYPGVPFWQQLEATLTPGRVLYEVWAQDQPTTPQNQFVHIGDISLTSGASTTLFGDQTMFMQHTRFEADLKYYPQWAAPAQAILNYQQSVPAYFFPDLPWN